MAYIDIHVKRIIENIELLSHFLESNNKSWTLVQKVLGSNYEVIKELLASQAIKHLHSVGDSHLSGLKAVKDINPNLKTLYIKPPALAYIPDIIRYADISVNTSLNTIFALNDEAKKQGKIHKIIIMIELGELREGVLRSQILKFYETVFNLPQIQVLGLGTNLGCMFGVQPNFDKLIQLSLYKQLIEVSFKQKLDIISGGSSITLPLIIDKKIPAEINHFRIGEAAFLGISPYNNEAFLNLNTNAFEFNSYIVELKKKSNEPDGVIGDSNVGTTGDANLTGESYKAIVDFGSLDVNPDYLKPVKDNIHFFGNSSDMTVYNLGNNHEHLAEGDAITYIPNYMGVANLMNSRFVDKEINK